ncbi:MAG: DUF47 family protein [Trueperella sp.]|nr:DUF47 family protein [Trueperella sp.]
MGKFSSKRNKVLELFRKQAAYTVKAAQLLAELAAAEPESRGALREALHQVENDADDATHELTRHVSQAFVLSHDREDLIALSEQLDECTDLIDEAGDNILLYRLGALPEELHQLIKIINRCCEITKESSKGISAISDKARNYWLEINQLENQGDVIYRKFVARLFDSEINALDVMRLKFVADTLEAAIDAFEHLATTVEIIAIKES